MFTAQSSFRQLLLWLNSRAARSRKSASIQNVRSTAPLYLKSEQAFIFCDASWSSGNAFVYGAGSLRFKSRPGQIGHSVVDGLPPLQHFFKRSCVAHKRNDAEMGPANSLHASAQYSKYNERFEI